MLHKLKFSFMDLQLMYYRADDHIGKPKYITIYYYVR